MQRELSVETLTVEFSERCVLSGGILRFLLLPVRGSENIIKKTFIIFGSYLNSTERKSKNISLRRNSNSQPVAFTVTGCATAPRRHI